MAIKRVGNKKINNSVVNIDTTETSDINTNAYTKYSKISPPIYEIILENRTCTENKNTIIGIKKYMALNSTKISPISIVANKSTLDKKNTLEDSKNGPKKLFSCEFSNKRIPKIALNPTKNKSDISGKKYKSRISYTKYTDNRKK